MFVINSNLLKKKCFDTCTYIVFESMKYTKWVVLICHFSGARNNVIEFLYHNNEYVYTHIRHLVVKENCSHCHDIRTLKDV